MTTYVCENCGGTLFELTNAGTEVCISCNYINEDKKFSDGFTGVCTKELIEDGFYNGFEQSYL